MIDTIVLAAGRSTRFAGSVPKQFREFSFGGSSKAQMWENAIGTFVTSSIHLVVRSHDLPRIKTTFVEGNIVYSERDTGGQLGSLLIALRHMSRTMNLSRRPVLVINCDQGFAPGILSNLVMQSALRDAPCAIVFKSLLGEEKRWSTIDLQFSDDDSDLLFLSASEKKATSPYALAGAYVFPDASLVETKIDAIIDSGIAEKSGELYISRLYEWLPGLKYGIEIRRDQFHDWGTQETFEESFR